MDDSTKKMLAAVGAGIAKKVLMLQAAGLVSHGMISSNQTETFVSLGMALVGAGWSFWDDYGRAIVLSQLEVLKAKSLAQASKLKDAGLPQVTVGQIAAQSATLSQADVVKAVAKLPAANQATVQGVAQIILLAIVVAGLLGFAGDARAQGVTLPKIKPPQITGDVAADTKANLGIGQQTTSSGIKLTGDPIVDLQAAITKGGQKLILNLKQSYALAIAKNAAGASADNTSATCTKALVPIFDLVVNGPKAGTVAADDPMALTTDEQTMASDATQPEGVVVKVQKIRILRLALQSPALNDACGALVQDEVKNAQNLIGKITSLVTGVGMVGIGL